MHRTATHGSDAVVVDLAARRAQRGGAATASGWRITERTFAQERAAATESVFAVANGYVGVRGAPEEGTPAHDPGVILNGFHETWPIVYPEDAYGLARTGQTIVNATDGSIIRLSVDGEPFDLSTARVTAFERTLDMRRGVLVREVEWETAGGRRMRLRSRRLASLEDRHLVAMDYEVVAVDGPARVSVSSELVTHPPRASTGDPRRGERFAEPVLVPGARRASGTRAAMSLSTRSSGLELACGIEHTVESAGRFLLESALQDDGAAVVLHAELEAGEPLRLCKYVGYHWGEAAAMGEHRAGVEGTLDRAARTGYDAIEAAHAAEVEAFWRRSDIEIDGDAEMQRSVRFSLFHLMQATARAEAFGVPAKGLTGRGYEGHYFWDGEIYVAPFLTHTTPEWAKELLRARCRMLPGARRRAAEVGYRGALYPWRTISGEEASAWYAAGTAQYHINADIAYAMRHYATVTGDAAFLRDEAAEVLIETARVWMELGFFSERRGGAFSINGVTGPDEYSAVVDNNAYTNLMAQEHLEGAVRLVESLREADGEAYARLADALALPPEEVDAWRAAAERMYVPRDEQLGILVQDEQFLDRKPWDFERTPSDRHPLLLHYHPLELYRHQVIKQPDAVLATYLLGHRFREEETRRTFDYYTPLTTGDSTLSAPMQSVMASALGYEDAAYDYFVQAATVDLCDWHGNAGDGIHIASCGGTWLAIVAGFAGLRDFDGRIAFRPRLPAAWTGLRFRLQVRGQTIEVGLRRAETTYTLVDGHGIAIEHCGEVLQLAPGEPVSVRSCGDFGAEPLPLAA